MELNKVVIVSAMRTPIGKLGGQFKDYSATELGSIAIEAALDNAGVAPELIEEVYMGNVLQAGGGQNPARQAAIGAGIPVTVPATTVNVVCASGLESINLAAKSILLGDADIVVAGGMESMSSAPFLVRNARFGYKFGNGAFEDVILADGLNDAYSDIQMGHTAENVAKMFDFTRTDFDEFALNSQNKAINAIDNNLFADEIVAVPSRAKATRGEAITQDEAPRRNVELEKMAKLKPAFIEDGVVTAGNAAGLNDGAAAVVLMSADKAAELGLTPLVEWEASTLIGLDPNIMGLGPIKATEKLLAKTDLAVDDIDLFEINEAFAAQAVPVVAELGVDPAKVNINGGAIALGHPLGASGARILVTLIHNMKRTDKQLGVATLCVGGGMGVATLVKRI
ncbi:acetyl-CoA C-acetyltransferase [Periweissella cryptocerci]|uniref:acetyl-CoA C-acetyltransferase n=1 Tax=Periweissella cryptocerci TaxID=2506420 RepID=A0A4P6YRF3_9LACO|nr:acetyl-CoA C-acetyltransferase [Periweissella cryptocerci]QBO35196.1 acetyl-CoA C-acetyltransferase [Periweissella cryptocerci]